MMSDHCHICCATIYCKGLCQKHYNAAYRATHKEQERKYNAKRNKAEQRQRNKEYYRNNRELLRKKQTEYYKANRHKAQLYRVRNASRLKQYDAEWKRNNPEKVRARDSNNKARKLNAEGRHTGQEIVTLFEKQKGRCAICKTKLQHKRYHKDHILPLASGGSNWIINIQLLCPPCNMHKNAKDPIQFMQERGFLL